MVNPEVNLAAVNHPPPLVVTKESVTNEDFPVNLRYPGMRGQPLTERQNTVWIRAVQPIRMEPPHPPMAFRSLPSISESPQPKCKKCKKCKRWRDARPQAVGNG